MSRYVLTGIELPGGGIVEIEIPADNISIQDANFDAGLNRLTLRDLLYNKPSEEGLDSDNNFIITNDEIVGLFTTLHWEKEINVITNEEIMALFPFTGTAKSKGDEG